MREKAAVAESAVDMLTVLTIDSDSFERVKRWEEDVRWVLSFNQGDSYILQVVKDLIDYLQTFDNFPVHVELLVKGVKGRHGVSNTG
jgi:hypothetical protein